MSIGVVPVGLRIGLSGLFEPIRFSGDKEENLVLVLSVSWDPPLKIQQTSGGTVNTNILVSEHRKKKTQTHGKAD